MKLPKPDLPLRTTLLYLLFGSLWILLSDQLLSLFVFHNAQQAIYQTIKGWFFIIVSGILLYVVLYKDLSDRKRDQDALRESEERFRFLFENNPAIMMLIEPVSGAVKNANQSAADFYGYPLSVLCTMNIGDINQLSPAEVQAERMRALREERNFFNFEHRLSSGELRSVEVHSAPIRLGEETLLFSIIHDTTDRRKAQQDLHDVQNRMRGIVESAMDAIISVNAEQQVVLANPAAEQMFGYGPGELVGMPLEILLPERYRQVHSEHIHRFGTTGSTTRSMHTLGSVYGLHASGREFLAEASISQITVGSEKIYTVIMRDVTERKLAEQRIQLQLQRLSALRAIDMAISSTFDMQISLDILLRETLAQLGVDAAAVLLLDPVTLTLRYAGGKGFTSFEMQQVALDLRDTTAGQAALERRQIHVENLNDANNRFTRLELLREEGFFSYFVTPLIAKGEVKGVLEIYHRASLQVNAEWLDFLETLAGQAAIAIENAQLFEKLHRSNLELEHRVAERTRQLHQTNLELEHANRTKDEFLANMSHELRTPLNSIIGLSESLLEERRGPLAEHQQKSVRIIESSGYHLLELINDILDLSKIDAGMFVLDLQPISVDEFCRSCMNFVRAQATKKSIALTYTNESPVSKIYADPRRLKQVIINLLTNAVKFTPEHGQMFLHVQGDLENDVIQFSVTDTGIGIDAEDLKRLFQPFVQVDSSLNRQFQGTGLGLALVRKLTDLHGGSVEVESEPGKGSRFTIKLSGRQDEITKLDVAKVPAPQPAGDEPGKVNVSVEASTQRGLILLADDNQPNIITIGEYLESYGYEVVVARDGVEAVTKAQEIHPDLMLMDIQMPVMNGLEAIARLRETTDFASTPIIALTALAMPGDRERCIQAGASEYLSKPVNLKSLVKTIEAMIESQH